MYKFSENGFKFALSDDGKPIEGFLGDEQNAELLIILKEPNNNNQPDFWFYNVVNNLLGSQGESVRDRKGLRFLRILGKLSCSILKEKSDDDDDIEAALKKCAFINLYPFDGESYAGKDSGYIKTCIALNKKLNNKKPKSECDKKYIAIAENRIELLENLSKSNIKYILTVTGVFAILSYRKNVKPYLKMEYGKNKTRIFNCCELTNGTKIFEFWHPSCRRINYTYLDEALSECNEH